MKLNDLSAFFQNSYDVLEMRVRSADKFEVGDMVSISYGPICTVKRLGSDDFENVVENDACDDIDSGENDDFRDRGIDDCDDKNASYAEFVSAEYRKRFIRRSLYRIDAINADVLTIEMLIRPNIYYDDDLYPEGLAVYPVDKVVSQSFDTFQREFQDNYSFFLGTKRYYLFAENINNNSDTFIVISPLTKKYYSITKKSFGDLKLSVEADSATKVYAIEGKERQLCNFELWRFSLHTLSIKLVDGTYKNLLAKSGEAIIASGKAKYIEIWDAYSDAEKTLVDDWYNSAGELEFSHCKANEKGQDVFDIVRGNVANFEYYVKMHFDGGVNFYNKRGKIFASGTIVANAMNRKNKITISTDCSIDGDGIIRPDRFGYDTNYERRKKAAMAILRDGAKNRSLAVIVSGEPVPSKKGGERLSLDESILKKIFGKNDANEAQRNAIEMAINTPDIAIIQGPPGTGKTKVIQAILAHFQKYENSQNKKDAASGSGATYLLTAYQREATRNIADGAEDRLGLPIFSYTEGRSQSGGFLRDYKDENDLRLEEWCNKCRASVDNISNLQEKQEQYDFIERLKSVEFYTGMPVKKAIDNLETLRGELQTNRGYSTREGGDKLSDVLNKIKNLQKNLDARHNLNKRIILGYIAAIPVCADALQDSVEYLPRLIGSLRLEPQGSLFHDLLTRFKEIAEKQNLQSEDYRELARIKVEMTLKLRNAVKVTDDEAKGINEYLVKAIETINNVWLNDKEKILFDYVKSMYPTEELKESIKKYREVDAATHQKVLSKALNGDGSLPAYKNIMVDEAARSCPADLLIPFACAEEKIVLVGDEKQLPQFLSQETLNELSRTLSESDIIALKKELQGESADKSFFSVSMFEYMINIAEKLHCRDGNNRVVMLQQQYRMPPVLGCIVSEQFYNNKLANGNDWEEGRVPERFMQHYSVIGGLNMCWIDVPFKDSRERKDESRSYFRDREIDVIFKMLYAMGRQFLNETDVYKKKNTGIGIITGYNAQSRRIMERLVSEAANSQLFEELKDYIQIGTIDSFQGKEFDIVFFSMVRTDDFGFLSAEEKTGGEWDLARAGKQRQCVAFSRAKKCMIVVGSADSITGENSEKAMREVPVMAEYYKACTERRGGVCEVFTEEDLDA